jgi:hypothetical protein
LEDVLKNIVAAEVETFFDNVEGSLSISIVNLGQYPISYYTSESSMDDLKSNDVVTHFAHKLTKLIHSKTKDSNYTVSITTHFFQYLSNHYGDNEDMLKTVVENLVRSDLLIILSHGSNDIMEHFTNVLNTIDSTILQRRYHLVSMFSFVENEMNRHPLIYNHYHHIKDKTEFFLVNTLLEKGFIIPSEGFMSFLYVKDRYALDATTRIMDGTEFYDEEKQFVFKKLMRFLLSVFSLLKTIKL